MRDDGGEREKESERAKEREIERREIWKERELIADFCLDYSVCSVIFGSIIFIAYFENDRLSF